MYRLVILPVAKQDIKEAASWYESKQKGLGKRFVLHVREKLNSLKKHPYNFVNRYDETRTAVFDVFPFMAHYNVDESGKTIIIAAVLHTSRNPEIWMEERGTGEDIDDM